MTAKGIRNDLAAVHGKFRWGDWLSLVLILVTPFVNFLRYHDYGLLYPDSLLAIVFLAGIGLFAGLLTRLWPRLLLPLFLAMALTYVVDVQPDVRQLAIDLMKYVLSLEKTNLSNELALLFCVFIVSFVVLYALRRNAGAILTAAFAVMLATTILMPESANMKRKITQVEFDVPATANGPARTSPPPVVHIVLDEHSGLEGIPGDVPGANELRDAIKDFYLGNGFRLYGGAFSPYYNTENSVSNLLNGTILSLDMPHLNLRGREFTLNENAWFELLGEQGYRISVYQVDFMDYCAAGSQAIIRCTTYPGNGIFAVRDIDAEVLDKVDLLIGNFLNPSVVNKFVQTLGYVVAYYEWDGKWKSEVEGLTSEPVGLGALWSVAAFEQMVGDLRTVKPGDAYFAHLLLPHRGFVTDRYCRPKSDLSKWVGFPSVGVKPGQRLSKSVRSAQYVAYFKQIRCTLFLLDKMMKALSDAGVLDEAIVIVHSDHGSRITGTPPIEKFAAGLTRMDLVDSLSTSFAIRSPGTEPGYDASVRSIQALFAELVLRRAMAEEPAVFFITPDERAPGTPLAERPLPNLRWDANQATTNPDS